MGKLRAILMIVIFSEGVCVNIVQAQGVPVTVRAEVPAGSGIFTQHSIVDIYMCGGVPMVQIHNGLLVRFTNFAIHHNGPGPNNRPKPNNRVSNNNNNNNKG